VRISQTQFVSICHAEMTGGPQLRQSKTYFVYIMTNRSKTLYTGVTNSLIRRVREHKLGVGSVFAAKYKLDRLVYFERFESIHLAIGREKQIKGWLRMKKVASIVSVNPAWRDLSLEWYERHPFQPDIPLPAAGSVSNDPTKKVSS
jgi:putative endonuclease